MTSWNLFVELLVSFLSVPFLILIIVLSIPPFKLWLSIDTPWRSILFIKPGKRIFQKWIFSQCPSWLQLTYNPYPQTPIFPRTKSTLWPPISSLKRNHVSKSIANKIVMSTNFIKPSVIFLNFLLLFIKPKPYFIFLLFVMRVSHFKTPFFLKNKQIYS